MHKLTLEPPVRSTDHIPGHVVELRDVDLMFGVKQVLRKVSLNVDPADRLVIIGQSGAGKNNHPAIDPWDFVAD